METKLTKEQFFAHLDSLTILELSDYVKEFETRYGISAAAAAPVMAAAGPAAEAKPAEEKTEFTVVLKSVGDKKINVIKVVREVTSLGPQGSQGPRRRRPQDPQGRRHQGRGRGHQGQVRRSRSRRRASVSPAGRPRPRIPRTGAGAVKLFR